ncbi:actin-7 [Reticulomyxa filosa]|uniref:Actin-7 n=1 Tax=Reticulomyxa filosa TaxID=46433 RepID=X6PBQ2_RETFI|nr:actin-7 [Reticulomyxa filosa]|eukprot:ETO35548.1 actin-7 [Reticulomyxa filosa]
MPMLEMRHKVRGILQLNIILNTVQSPVGTMWRKCFVLHRVEDIKEKLAYVVEDYHAGLKKVETSNDIEKNYELTDGQVIIIGAERFRRTKVLLSPTYWKGSEGIHKLAYKNIMKCDLDICRDLYTTIVVWR